MTIGLTAQILRQIAVRLQLRKQRSFCSADVVAFLEPMQGAVSLWHKLEAEEVRPAMSRPG